MTEPVVAENGSESPPTEVEGGDTSEKMTSEEAATATTPVPSEPTPEEEKDQQQADQTEKTEADTKKEESNNDAEKAAAPTTTPEEEKPTESASPTDKNTTTTDTKSEKTASESEGVEGDKDEKKTENTSLSLGPVVSASKRTRPPYKYDPEKVTLRFLFANKDGLTVTVECKPGDTVGEVKGQLMSVWPEGKYKYTID